MSVFGGYYIGIDAGTDSLGWAVTDKNYNIIRKKGKSLWGIRLFEAAVTAEDRRMFRTTRRRYARRRQRIRLLQEMFKEALDKIDPKFIQRLNDSALWAEDKYENQIYSLFNDADFTDREFYDEYPTIYHLRAALIKEDKAFDVRLVYLALHHLMKNRGHFLFSGSLGKVTSFENTYNEFIGCLKDEFDIELECASAIEFENIIKDKKLSKTQKWKKLQELCNIPKSDKQTIEILKLITGCKVKLSVIFNDEIFNENEIKEISFSDGDYQELKEKLESEIYEKAELVDIMHSVYDFGVLADILSGGAYEGTSYLSIAKVNMYNKHKEDLKLLKSFIKTYVPEKYVDFFAAKGTNNYCAYVGGYKKNGKTNTVKRCNREDLYKGIKNLLKTVTLCNEEIKQYITDEMERESFLPLQVSNSNGVIPYQVNKAELERILVNAEKYLPFLSEVDDECGKTVKEKIVALFEFRIPYYVGPLNTAKGENAWMVRKAEGAVRPWNFNEKVDIEKTAEAFIKRMTNQCTYIEKESVIPKYSLLYCKFMVLNELNNIKINGEKISVELKQRVFNNLFKKEKQVTGKKLLNYLNTNEGYELEKEDLSGFDGNFKASLTSYIELKNKVFGDEIEKYSVQKFAENIINWVTLYGDDKKLLKHVLEKECGDKLTDGQIKEILRLKFNGWGRLSGYFLNELEGADCENGECFTIIGALWNTQNNLMQLLSRRFTFTERIKEENQGYEIEGEITYDKLVKDIVASPAIKRTVWQTVRVVEEIKKVMGSEPEKIFIEMARGSQEKVRTESRKTKLMKLYDSIKKEHDDGVYEELKAKDDSDLKSIKLYLYFTQLGRCMYSGERIDLNRLNDATVWDRDHIYPQSKTADDSIDNLVLVKKEINSRKSNGLIDPQIQYKMSGFWKSLKNAGLISDKKYSRLIRTIPLTNEELAGFINRQLVETRQSTKVLAALLDRIYPNTEMVYVKAGNVSEFRKRDKTQNGVKVRDLNDYHHAKDAYLNIVVGNVYHTKFTSNPLNWLNKNPKTEYSLKRMYDFDVISKGETAWKRGADGTQALVNKTLVRNDILYTRYAYCNKGELFNQQMVKATGDSSKNILVPIKKSMPTWKYGGYNSVTPAYFMLVESKGKKGKLKRTIEAVPLYRVKEFSQNKEAILDYCRERLELTAPRIVIPCIKKNAKLVIDGFPMHLKGTTGKQLILQNAVQLCIDSENTEYLKKVTKYLEANAKRSDKKTLLTANVYMKLSKEKNIILYDVFLYKLSNSIYKYRPANPYKNLADKRDKFLGLSIEEQCVVLGEILHLFQCKPITANLTVLGLSGNIGAIQKNKDITGASSAKLVYQSPTGLFEYTVDLQKI